MADMKPDMDTGLSVTQDTAPKDSSAEEASLDTIAADGQNYHLQALDRRTMMRTCVNDLWNQMVDEEKKERDDKAATAKAMDAEALAAFTDEQPADNGGGDPMMIDLDSMDLDVSSNASASPAKDTNKLDLHLLAEHVKASSAPLQVAQRDVVILLGNTGVGKSLLIQAVAGRQVQWKDYSSKDGSSKWVWDVVDPVEGFDVGHDQKSKTTCLRHYVTGPDSDSVVYLDAPGYEDTGGQEVDIATSVAFSQVAEQCSRMRFVVLIDCNAFKVNRGGVMRGVVKLVSSFVFSFSDKKLAFTFLFTKSDSLGDAQTPADARKLLSTLVNETLNGSDDNEVRKMLKWMRHCLQNNLPFVDVYHPAFSNILQLRESMETFSRPNTVTAITSPRDEVRFGMTSKAETQLKLDLRDLSEELTSALGESRFARAERLFGTLQALHAHVKNAFLSEAYAGAMRSWEEFGRMSAQKTYTLMQKGLGAADRGTSDGGFKVADGREVFLGIAHLQLLERIVHVPGEGLQPGPAENAFDYLSKGLTSMSAMVSSDIFSTGAGVSHGPERGSSPAELQAAYQARATAFSALAMLRVWGKVHDVFALWAQPADAALQEGVKKAVVLAASLAGSRERPDPSQLALAFIQLAQARVLDASLCTDDISAGMDKCKHRLQEITLEIKSEAAAALGSNGNGEEAVVPLNGGPDLVVFFRCLQSMEGLCAALAVPELDDVSLAELCDVAGAARFSVLTEAKTFLHKLLEETGRVAASSPVASSLEQCLTTIRQTASSLTKTQHMECETTRIYEDAVAKAGEAIRELRERAEARCTHAVEDNRLAEPSVHVAALRQLKASAWFDAHLLACGQAPFVDKAVSKLSKQYEGLCERTTSALTETLRQCLRLGMGAAPQLELGGGKANAKLFQDAAGVLKQLGPLGAEVPGIAQLVRDFVDMAIAAIDEWSQQLDGLGLGELECSAAPRHIELAALLEHTLGTCETLRLVDALAHRAEDVSSLLVQHLSSLHTSITELFGGSQACSERSERKCVVVVGLQSWQELNLSRVLKHLPDAGQLLAEIVVQVGAAATAARTAVMESTGDSDAAEAALSDLVGVAQAFEALDCGKSAGAAASDLRQVLDLRGAQLQDTLHESLREGRFGYVRDYIRPLLGAGDALKREKLGRVLAAANDMLRQKAEAAERHIANAPAVAEVVRVLVCAGEHVGAELMQHHSFDASKTAEALREQATAHLTGLVEKLEAALASLSYRQVFEQAAVVGEFLDATRTLLVVEAGGRRASKKARGQATASSGPAKDIRKRTKQLLDKAGKCLDDVDKQVSRFAKYLRGTECGQAEFDTAELCTMLNKLQDAASAGGAVAERYSQATQKLTVELGAALKQVRQQAEEEQLFTMATDFWSYLQREMGRGLEGHVSLGLDLQAELEQMRELDEKASETMRANCLTVERLERHVKAQLTDLKSKSSGVFGWWNQRQYSHQRQIFRDQVAKMLENTETAMLTQKNYALAGQIASVLQYIFHVPSLAAHLEDKTKKAWKRLSEMIVTGFRLLCTQLKDTLDQGDANFKHLLQRIHEFEDGLFAVYPDELVLEAQGVHQALYEWLKSGVDALTLHLRDFELSDAAAKVRLLRSAGSVLVTTFALYLDLAEADRRHSVQDRWLRLLHGECAKHFDFEAARVVGVHFAILQLDLAAASSEKEVVKAYKVACLKHHPDKGGSTAMQQRVNTAKDQLQQKSVRASFKKLVKMPFRKSIEQVPKAMLHTVQDLLKEHEYEQVAQKLLQLADLPKLMMLAGMAEAEVPRVREPIQKAVQEHMKSLRVKVGQLWQQRDFKELNKQLDASEQADAALVSFDVYSSEWSREIQASVEDEIERIASKARIYMAGQSEEKAERKMGDFALKLIYLGRILDDLPRFKDFCRQKMSGLLDLCHESSWGCCFVFKLGMLLGQGKVGDLDKDGKVVSEDDRIGKTIVSDFKHFKDVTTMVWNEEVTQKDVGSVAREAKAWSMKNKKKSGVVLSTKTLVEGFKEYEKEYARCFDEWHAGRLELDALAQRAINAAAAVQPESTKEWSQKLVTALPTMVAQVFCYFTVVKSGESYRRLTEHKDKLAASSSSAGSKGAAKVDNILYKPHSTQVLTVLQMLGYGGASGQLQCQLMQIRTGEGKSVILGACSVVLALLGFSVRCVCYSEYLSSRDFAFFGELFDGFGVRHRVAYSTITDYSEHCARSKGDIRELTAALLRGESRWVPPNKPHKPEVCPGPRLVDSAHGRRGGGSQAAAAARPHNNSMKVGKKRGAAAMEEAASSDVSASKVPRVASNSSANKSTGTPGSREILLVDEVDVFFGKDFYGRTHNQVVQLDAPEASELLRAVWRLRTNGSDTLGYNRLLREVSQSPEYANICQRFGEWRAVIEREVKAMCADVLCFDDPKPEYNHGLDKLGYKVMDGIDYDNAVYRYRTAFAHLDAVDNNVFRNPDAALKRALYLQVPCSKFSYANIRPGCILGVSGTLEALSDYETQVMERYHIQLFASMPSVYGNTRLKFDHAGDGIAIEKSEADFQRTVTDEVNKKIREGRAVIVFFETAKQLEGYKQSQYFKKVMHANVLHESLDPKKRDHVIRKAATSGQATFASAVFGRGTDFFCQDSKLTAAGGVHVIQTFLSLQRAEEVQIQGRTARQGKQGTYGLILQQSDLEARFGLGPAAFDKVARCDWYATLDEARQRAHAAGCAEIEKDLAEATRLDALTHQYFDTLVGAQGKQSAASCFLDLHKELRPEEPHAAGGYHIIFLTDTSGSMSDNDAVPTAQFAAYGYNNRLGCALEACDTFVRQRSAVGAADIITLIPFSSSASTALAAKPLQDNMITELLRAWRPASGGTNFGAAFESAATTVRRDISGLPVLIMFLTDGQDHGCSHTLDHAISTLNDDENVSLKAIGFSPEADVENLKRIAKKFGERGECIAAIDGVELVGSFEAAAAELSHTGKRGRSD